MVGAQSPSIATFRVTTFGVRDCPYGLKISICSCRRSAFQRLIASPPGFPFPGRRSRLAHQDRIYTKVFTIPSSDCFLFTSLVSCGSLQPVSPLFGRSENFRRNSLQRRISTPRPRHCRSRHERAAPTGVGAVLPPHASWGKNKRSRVHRTDYRGGICRLDELC
jgi:hypothetical protein